MKSWTQVIEARQEAVHVNPDDWTDDMRAAAGATGVIAYEVLEPIVPGSPVPPPVDMATIVNAAVEAATAQTTAMFEQLLARFAGEQPTDAPPPAPAPADVMTAQEAATKALADLEAQRQAGASTPTTAQQ